MSCQRSVYAIAVSMVLGLCAVVLAPAGTIAAANANLMINPGFEDGVNSDGLPVGWPAVFAGRWGENFDLSPVSFAGDWSLKVVDPDQKTGVGLRSSRVAVQSGKHYMASVKVYNAASATGSLYLEFWDEAGNRVLAPFEWRPGDKDVWTEVVVVAEAPGNAKYATVLLYSSSIAVGTVYFDEVSLILLD